MGKFNIGGFNIIFNYHSKEFFDERLKDYQANFLDEEADMVMNSYVNNNIKVPDAKIVIDNNHSKILKDDKGINYLIVYARDRDFMVYKVIYDDKFENVTIEFTDREHQILTVSDREYMFTGQYFNSMITYKKGAMIHSSGISYKGNGIIFSADSGTGKSTHTGLWQKVYPNDVEYINDDKPIIRVIDGSVYMYGTPWSGKTDLNKNVRVPLKAIVMLNRGETNSIEEVNFLEVLKQLITNINLMKESKGGVTQALTNYNELFSKVKIYKLFCNMDLDAPVIVKNKVFGINDEYLG